MNAIWAQVYAREAPPPLDVDEDLYGGFVGNADRRRLNDLRELSGEKLATQRASFDDPRLEELLFRYRARNFEDTLDEAGQERWQALRVARLLDGEGGALSVDAYFAEIDQLAESADERAEEILGALHDYAETVVPEAD